MEMIPERCMTKKGWHAENKVFEYLKATKLDGFAIHSRRFFFHKYYGKTRDKEVDFLIVTSRGILVLEVKGGEIKCDKHENWTSTDHYGNVFTINDPYKQANANMHALKDTLEKSFSPSEYRNIPMAYGVVFPDTKIETKSISMPKTITFSKNDDPQEFGKFIVKCHDYAPKAGPSTIDDRTIDMLRKYLCNTFGKLEDLRGNIDENEESIKDATEEQCEILDTLREVPRLMIYGGAGTGKTLLALSHAERLASTGMRVLFLTYNKLFKQFLIKERPLENVTYDNFDNFIYKALSGERPTEDNEEAWASMKQGEKIRIFNQVRPTAFINQEGLSECQKYDAVVVDEAQDILNQKIRLKCIDLMVKDGLEKGNVAFFYDADQDLFNTTRDGNELEETIEILMNKYSITRYPLLRNCRNTKQIIEFTCKATGLGGEVNPKMINGDPVEIMYYRGTEDKSRKLADIVRKLKDKKIAAEDIVILSHRGVGPEDSSLHDTSNFAGIFPVEIMDQEKEYRVLAGILRLSNIYNYKGLQEKVVIVTDVDKLEDEKGKPQRENYACFSRAKSKLYVLANEELKPRLDGILENLAASTKN